MGLANGIGKRDSGVFSLLFLCVSLCPLALLTADPTGPPGTHKCSPHVSPKIPGQSELKQEKFKKSGSSSVLRGVELGRGGAMITLVTLRPPASLTQGPRAHPEPLKWYQSHRSFPLEPPRSLPWFIPSSPLQHTTRLQFGATLT